MNLPSNSGTSRGMTASAARHIDHLVLPTAALDVARARLAALGFTVAPVGIHPFGTSNSCVYLADGTFLEPLAIADTAAAARATGEGNVFVARDAAFRTRHGAEGFSALVLATDDAESDHAAFGALGLSAGAPLEFARPFVDAAGRTDTARFRLAFAAPAGVEDIFAFTCQRMNAPAVARDALQRHANGVARLSEVVAIAANPAEAADFFRNIANAVPVVGANGRLNLALGNVTLSIQPPQAFAEHFACPPPRGGALRYAAIVFAMRDVPGCRAQFRASGVTFHEADGRLVVPPAPGQGTYFMFEELP